MFFLFTSSLELVVKYSRGFPRSVKNLSPKPIFSSNLLLAQLTSTPIFFAAQAGNVDVFDIPFPIHLGLKNLFFFFPSLSHSIISWLNYCTCLLNSFLLLALLYSNPCPTQKPEWASQSSHLLRTLPIISMIKDKTFKVL